VCAFVVVVCVASFAEDAAWLPSEYALRNLAQHVFPGLPRTDLPLKVAPFVEHVRAEEMLFTAEEAKDALGIAIGDDGKVRPLDVKVGDKVIFGKYSGQTVKVGDDELLVMREDDVMAIVE